MENEARLEGGWEWDDIEVIEIARIYIVRHAEFIAASSSSELPNVQTLKQVQGDDLENVVLTSS